MRRRVWMGIGLAAAGGVLATGYFLKPRAMAADAPPPPRKVDLTVYSQDFGLVRETRGMDLTAGLNRLAAPEVSQSLDPESVLLRWVGSGAAPEIIGHSYDLGAGDSRALLKQEVGKPVEIVRYGQNGREAERERGRLLVAEAGRPSVVEVDGKLYVNPEGTLVLSAQDRAPAIPQLTVQAKSASAQHAALDLAYLTRGLSWDADYVATLADADDRLDLECYATLRNQTGVRFPDASITLVAGSPNRAVTLARSRTLPGAGARPNPFDENADGRVQQRKLEFLAAEAPEAVGELEAYPLKNPATIQNDQLNRLLMFRRQGLKITKDYAYRAPYLDCWSSPQQPRGAVTVSVSFKNSAADAVGKPMPPGAVRVYDPDKQGRLRYAGAANLPSTPKDTRVNLTLGNAFDVTAAYRTVKVTRLNKHKVRKQVEIRLENARQSPLKVRVVQGFGTGWTIVQSGEHSVKTDSGTAQWTVDVPVGGKTISFTTDLVG